MKGWIIANKMYHARILERGLNVVDKNMMYENPVRELYQEGLKRGIEVEVLLSQEVNFSLTEKGAFCFFVKGEKRAIPDFVIPRTGSRTDSAAIALYRQLELIGVPMINHADGIIAAFDKFSTAQLLAKHQLPIPKTLFVAEKINLDIIEREFSFPLIVKTWPSSNGDGVFLALDKYNLEDIISTIGRIASNVNVLIQEYISHSRGRDIRVYVLGGKVIAMLERSAADGGYKSNYGRGGTLKKIDRIPEVEELAIRASTALNLECSGVDILYDIDSYKICEVNSAPGFSLVTGIGLNPAAILYDYLFEKNKELCI